jgi:O-succinylbenzoic acid--CoA ligase
MYPRRLIRAVRDWLSQRRQTSPEATALVDTASGATRSYDEVSERCESLAGRLAAEGVCVDDHVGMLVGSRPEAVEIVHATMRVGARLVPFSPRLTPRELETRLGRADLDVLLCEAGTDAVATEAVRRADATGELPVRSVDDGGELPAIGATDPRPFDLPEWALGDPLVMLATSGTTGIPKLVVLTVGNVLASATASAFHLGVLPDDRWASPLSPSSMGGLAPVYRTVLYGSSLVLCPTDAEALRAGLVASEATGVSLVPTLLRRLLDAGPLPDSLRFVLLGGAPAPESLIERCGERGVPVCPTYGMTETASQVATVRPGRATEHPGSVGRPLMFTDVTIVDEAGDPLPNGEPGEIVVSGPTVTPGYYEDRPGTARAFGAYGLHTGDVGSLDDEGRLWIHSRKDDRIVTGGQTVDPSEVRAVLRTVDGVADAAVVGLPDEEWGERVAALVEPVAGASLDERAVEVACRERLATHKVPRVLSIGTLPRTESGTADRGAVRDRLRDASV